MKRNSNEPVIEEVSIADLTADQFNFNRGTERGNWMLGKSLEKLGAGRSILLDKNNRIIAGNKTAAKFGEMGLERVLIVKTDGNTLVAVQREDLDLDTPKGREMALADNRVGEVNLDFDMSMLDLFPELELLNWFNETELQMLANDGEIPDDNKDIDEDKLEESDCECPKCGFQWKLTSGNSTQNPKQSRKRSGKHFKD